MYRTDGRVSWPVKLWYASGQSGASITDFGFGVLLFIYYNQVLGLSGTYTGLGVGIALFFDALTDPAVGSWSDGFKSRWGRRHIFMAASVIPLGLGFLGLFMPPTGLSQLALFAWFTVFSIVVRTAQTFFNVPYLSLGAELTQDYQERTQIVSLRLIVSALSTLAVTGIGWNFFFIGTPSNPTPQLTRSPYLSYALASMVGIWISLALATRFTTATIPHLAGSHQQERTFGLKRVYRDLFEALQNNSYRVLFVGTLIYFVYAGTQGALSMHLATFYWRLDTLGIQWTQYAGLAGALCGVPLASAFNRWLDKKWTVIVGVGVGLLCDNVPIFMKLADWMPHEMRTLVYVLVVVSFASAFFGVQASITVSSMMGDVADEHELKHGRRQEGVYFGSYSFSQKCTGAFGNMIAGFAIDLIGLNPSSNPADVPADVLFRFGAFYGIPALLVGAAIWVFWPYSLNRARHAEIVEQLKARASAAEQTDGDVRKGSNSDGSTLTRSRERIAGNPAPTSQ